MNFRKFGNTDLIVSEIGFGAWGIGGPSMAGKIPIGWGITNDDESIKALKKAYDQGINFYDTADFYGLGHSEELIAKVISPKNDAIIATKVGHRLSNDNSIVLDYSKKYILKACHESLRRLKRNHIDYYQLHSARVQHLENGECIEAMKLLKEQGKIRYWGISLNTFNPFPEADFFIRNKIGDGFQLVLNIINQRAMPILKTANKNGYGIIARMPLQFGLLTGKFSTSVRFPADDHRSFRLTENIIEKSIDYLNQIWTHPKFSKFDKTTLSISFILAYKEISTVIPGMKTVQQVLSNTARPIGLSKNLLEELKKSFNDKFAEIVDLMENQG